MEYNWLLEDSDLKLITNDYEFNWAWTKLVDNGVTSPSDARSFIEIMRFEYGYPDCPKCGCIDNHYKISFEAWKCKNCGLNFSITAQTYIDNTKLEYYMWFRFSYLIGGIGLTNSNAIARDLKVTQKTAWGMIETLRTARKETSQEKFKTGSEVLMFNHLYEPLELLLKRKNQPPLFHK